MKKKIIIGIVGIAIVVGVILFFYRTSRDSIYIDIGDFNMISRTECIKFSIEAERYVKEKYGLGVKVSRISLSAPYRTRPGPGVIVPYLSQYRLNIIFNDNEYISSLGMNIFYDTVIKSEDIKIMHSSFHTKYRNDCIKFCQRIEECIERKYNKKLMVDEISPWDSSSNLSYLVSFTDGSATEISSNSNKLFDLDSLDLENFELKEGQGNL